VMDQGIRNPNGAIIFPSVQLFDKDVTSFN
jgi:hypothetical protein